MTIEKVITGMLAKKSMTRLRLLAEIRKHSAFAKVTEYDVWLALMELRKSGQITVHNPPKNQLPGRIALLPFQGNKF